MSNQTSAGCAWGHMGPGDSFRIEKSHLPYHHFEAIGGEDCDRSLKRGLG